MSENIRKKALIRKVDCIRIPVPDLDAGLKFYMNKLGHKIIWRTKSAVGLKLPDCDAEFVIHTEPDNPETDLLVDSVEEASQRFVEAGGSIVAGPFDIEIGKCVIVKDPWNNQLVLIDTSKGTFITDSDGNIIGRDKN